MKLSRFALPVVAAACIFTVGCAHPYYGPPPPPPPGYAVPPMIARAQSEGFRIGSANGARDAYNRFGHHPQRDPAFHRTPGYDPSMGPYGPYRNAFRNAYLHGYDQSFYRR
jgi:hypothetical protein